MRPGLLLVLGALAVSCDSSSPSPPVTAAGLTRAFAEVVCAQMRRCGGPDDFPSAEVRAVFSDAACPGMPQVQAFLDDEFNLARLRQSVQGGRATLDGALARACVDELRSLSCPSWAAAADGQQAAMPDACRRMIQGLQPVGAPCQLNFEHECESGSCGGAAAATCVAAPGAGQACPSRCEDVFDCSARCEGALRCGSDDVCAPAPAPSPPDTCDGT